MTIGPRREPEFVGRFRAFWLGLVWRFGDGGDRLYVPGGAGTPAPWGRWIPADRIVRPAYATSAEIYDRQFSAVAPDFSEFQKILREELVASGRSAKEAADIQLGMYAELFYWFRLSLGDQEEVAAWLAAHSGRIYFFEDRPWDPVQNLLTLAREWLKLLLRGSPRKRERSILPAKAPGAEPRLLVFCEDRRPRGLNFTAVDPILPALASRFSVDLSVRCTGDFGDFREKILQTSALPGLRWVGAPVSGQFRRTAALLGAAFDRGGWVRLWGAAVRRMRPHGVDPAYFRARTHGFIRNLRELELGFRPVAREWVRTHTGYSGALVVPDSTYLSCIFSQELRAVGIPTYTVDTCLLAEFGGNGVPRHDVTYVSGKWNEHIYLENQREVLPSPQFHEAALGRLREIEVVGATKMSVVAPVAAERLRFARRAVLAPENTGFASARARIEQIVGSGVFDEILVWPHPLADFGPYLELRLPSVRVERREDRDYDKLVGAIGVAEYSTMGFEFAMRGAFFVSMAARHSDANPYSRTKTVPLVSDAEGLREVVRRFGESEGAYSELQRAQARELREWFNAAPVNGSVGDLIAESIARHTAGKITDAT